MLYRRIFLNLAVLFGVIFIWEQSVNRAGAAETVSAVDQGVALDKNIQYYVLAQDIRGALQDVSSQIKIPIVPAANVKGKASAGKYAGKARNVLDSLTADLNLHWYFDGRTIYVTPVQDALMHVVRLKSFNFKSLSEALDAIKVDTKQFPLKYDPENNMAVVYGPPRYVATVEVVAHYLTLRGLDKPAVLRN